MEAVYGQVIACHCENPMLNEFSLWIFTQSRGLEKRYSTDWYILCLSEVKDHWTVYVTSSVLLSLASAARFWSKKKVPLDFFTSQARPRPENRSTRAGGGGELFFSFCFGKKGEGELFCLPWSVPIFKLLKRVSWLRDEWFSSQSGEKNPTFFGRARATSRAVCLSRCHGQHQSPSIICQLSPIKVLVRWSWMVARPRRWYSALVQREGRGQQSVATKGNQGASIWTLSLSQSFMAERDEVRRALWSHVCRRRCRAGPGGGVSPVGEGGPALHCHVTVITWRYGAFGLYAESACTWFCFHAIQHRLFPCQNSWQEWATLLSSSFFILFYFFFVFNDVSVPGRKSRVFQHKLVWWMYSFYRELLLTIVGYKFCKMNGIKL